MPSRATWVACSRIFSNSVTFMAKRLPVSRPSTS